MDDEGSLEKARRLVPCVIADMITDAGHVLSMDQPELVNRRIVDFLSAQGGEALSDGRLPG
jgi:pimeloyl-ACP methyl ester carboxylesterase